MGSQNEAGLSDQSTQLDLRNNLEGEPIRKITTKPMEICGARLVDIVLSSTTTGDEDLIGIDAKESVGVCVKVDRQISIQLDPNNPALGNL